MLSNHLMVNVQVFRDGGGEGLSDNDSVCHADDNESGATSSARRDYTCRPGADVWVRPISYGKGQDPTRG